MVRIAGRAVIVVAPEHHELAVLRRRIADNPRLAGRIAIASSETIRAFVVARRYGALLHYAINRLARVFPRLSAGRQHVRGLHGANALVAALLSTALVAPVTWVTAMLFLLTVFFTNCSVWKLRAAFSGFGRSASNPCSTSTCPPTRCSSRSIGRRLLSLIWRGISPVSTTRPYVSRAPRSCGSR